MGQVFEGRGTPVEPLWNPCGTPVEPVGARIRGCPWHDPRGGDHLPGGGDHGTRGVPGGCGPFSGGPRPLARRVPNGHGANVSAYGVMPRVTRGWLRECPQGRGMSTRGRGHRVWKGLFPRWITPVWVQNIWAVGDGARVFLLLFFCQKTCFWGVPLKMTIFGLKWPTKAQNGRKWPEMDKKGENRESTYHRSPPCTGGHWPRLSTYT